MISCAQRCCFSAAIEAGILCEGERLMLMLLALIAAALALPWEYFIGERPVDSEWQAAAPTIHPTRYALPIQHTPILPFMP